MRLSLISLKMPANYIPAEETVSRILLNVSLSFEDKDPKSKTDEDFKN